MLVWRCAAAARAEFINLSLGRGGRAEPGPGSLAFKCHSGINAAMGRAEVGTDPKKDRDPPFRSSPKK